MATPQQGREFPTTDEELAELRERVRTEHAAYLKHWAAWSPRELRSHKHDDAPATP